MRKKSIPVSLQTGCGSYHELHYPKDPLGHKTLLAIKVVMYDSLITIINNKDNLTPESGVNEHF